jgi:hypothetical protein
MESWGFAGIVAVTFSGNLAVSAHPPKREITRRHARLKRNRMKDVIPEYAISAGNPPDGCLSMFAV